MRPISSLSVVVISSLVLGLSGCGSGSTNSSNPANPANSLAGVAAAGAPVSGSIYLKDSSGQERQFNTSDGYYTFSLDGLTPPYMLKAQWSVSNQAQTLYSIATQPGTANITPLTQVIVMAAAKTTSLDGIYSAPAQNLGNVVAALPAAVVDVQKTLNPLFSSFSQSGANPITDSFIPNHTGMDALLDSVTVSSAGGNISVSNTLSGSLILQSPAAHVANGIAIPDWSDQNALVSYHPDVAVDSNGNGLVAWSETVGSQSLIRTRFLNGSGAAAVNVSNAGDSQNPRIAFDGAGNAIMVWEQYQSTRGTIWSSRYAALTKAWSTPQQISDPTPVADSAGQVVGIDNAGNAIAVWSEGNGTANHLDVWSARYDATQNSWSTANIVSDQANNAYEPQIAINATGHGLVAWVEDQTVGSNQPMDVWARSVTSAGVWGTQTRVNGTPASSSRWVDAYFSLAMDANGNGGAMWVQNANLSGTSEINWAYYSSTGSWQPSSVVPGASGSGFRFPMFAFDGDGNAFAVWREFITTPPNPVLGSAARYTVGTGWGPIIPFTTNTQAVVMDPRLAVDGVGNASIVWYELQQVGSAYVVPVKSIRYLIDTGWDSEIQISSPNNMDGFTTCPAPRVGANSAGQTLTIWGYSDNTC
jgi:hypothetical protein